MNTNSATEESRIAVIGIIIEDTAAAAPLNEILHEYSEYIIGRMGIPYRKKDVHIISIAIDAPTDITSALTGRIGRLPGIRTKTAYASRS
ncbi:TM1266 family iron-only hydrogenase system putative regulator [Lachnoclostridium sp. Marseille-P6806]|uniref:TM1266 family iron-only hydrogenase system putative regulator n=1 Tax=Lachnoclostridium sp. Marseille-P6806 TaxID=2364793 RepID=UPI0010321BBA|nr:TM1266 family iron-only hydrogenase system putative regulator [Lachnoclostridium sp. Marseille-P6806]